MPHSELQDPFDLNRFIGAQTDSYASALAELKRGKKQTHWAWFILPQLCGLGHSHHAQFYGIGSKVEATAYLAHPLLRARLIECVRAISRHTGQSTESILGPIDALKFCSCLTLFEAVAPDVPEFAAALQQFYGGSRCSKTLSLLAEEVNSSGV